MAIQGYSSNTVKRIFVNTPFRSGMNFAELIVLEKQSKLLVNLDIAGAGDFAHPRPAFANAVLHNGTNSVRLPENVFKQQTSNGATFLIGSDFLINESDYAAKNIGDSYISSAPLSHTFGLQIAKMTGDIVQFNNRFGYVQVVPVSVIDGNTIQVYDYTDITQTPYNVRLLGITPEPLESDYEVADEAYVSNESHDVIYRRVDALSVCIRAHVFQYGESLPTGIPIGTRVYQWTNLAFTQYATYDWDGDVWVPFGSPTNISIALVVTDTCDITTYPYHDVNPFGVAAKDYLTAKMADGLRYYIEYDPISEEEDGDGNKLAYVFKVTEDEFTTTYSFMNTYMLVTGLAVKGAIDDGYKYYSKLGISQVYAVDFEYGVHSAIYPADPTTVVSYVIPSDETIEDEGATGAYVLLHGADPTAEADLDNSYFKKAMTTADITDTNVYDSKGYFEENMVPTDLFTPSGADMYVVMLQNSYTKQEYQFNVVYKEIPHAEHTWRNAVSFFGLLVDNGVVVYKGIITLQYDLTEHRVIIQKPHEVAVGTFNNQDPTSVVFNAMDDDPYVFEDEIFTDGAGAFPYPTVLASYIYDRILTGTNDAEAKILSGFNSAQACFIKPYLAFPDLSGYTDLVGVYIRYLYNDDHLALDKPEDYGWTLLYDPVTDQSAETIQTTVASLSMVGEAMKVFDFSRSASRPVTIELKTTRHADPTITVLEGTSGNIAAEANSAYDKRETKTFRLYGISGVDTTSGAIVQRITYTIVDTVTQEFVSVNLYGTHYTADPVPMYTFQSGDTLSFSAYNIDYEVDYAATPETFLINVTESFVTNVSIGTTQLVLLTGTKTLDPHDMLSSHDIWNATQMAQFDRYTILYGRYMGSHSIQFLEYNTTDFAPFPYGQITFDSEVRHVHSHRGSLYVFCDDGVWILHSGLTYADMKKTFAYSGISLEFAEKGSVCSIGNSVFCVHNSKGYSIRTNTQVSDQSDIYAVMITAPIDGVLNDPRMYIKERLEQGYGIVVDSANKARVHYRAYADSNELYFYASYYINEPVQNLMITYIYDVDNKRWRMYDTVAGSYPLEKISSGNIKGFDLILRNHDVSGFPTYATYLYELPTNNRGYVLGDARSLAYIGDSVWELSDEDNLIKDPVMPIAVEMDTGGLGFDTVHNKKVRRINVDFVNISGSELQFKIMPYVDNLPINDEATVTAVLNVYGDIIEETDDGSEIIVPTVYRMLSPGLVDVPGFELTDGMFTTKNRVRLTMHTNMHGRVPGFKLFVPVTDRCNILQYALVYRQQGAR